MDTLVRHKSFTYRTSTEWLGGKAAQLSSFGKPILRVASPPEFRGEPNVWTPEDLIVAAVETCLLMTFTSIAAKRGIDFEAYYSEAVGLLYFTKEHYRFTRIEVKPTIIVREEAQVEAALKAIEDAHKDCLIANSLSSEVVIDPEVRTRDAA